MAVLKLIASLSEKVKEQDLENIIAEGEAGGYDVKAYLSAAYDKMKTYNVSRKFLETELADSLLGDGTEEVTVDDFNALLDMASGHEQMGGKAKLALKTQRIEFSEKSPSHAQLLLSLLAKTGLKGVGKTAIKKYADIYEFEVARGLTYSPKEVKEWPIFGEPKHDGMRVEIVVTNGIAQAMSREGFEVKSLNNLLPEIGQLAQEYANEVGIYDNFVFGAEGLGGDGTFNGSLSALKTDTPIERVNLKVFYIATMDEFKGEQHVTMKQLRDRMVEARFYSSELKSIGLAVTMEILPSVILQNEQEADEFFNQMRRMGLEGAIYKQPNMPFKPTKNKGWLKRKPKDTVDVRILGFEEGLGESAGKTGAIVVDYKGKHVSVGSGLTNTSHIVKDGQKVFIEPINRPESDRDRIWQHKELYLGKIVEISFMEETPDGSLRHPVFERMRFDKDTVSYS